ncbi:MAG TPA: septum formation initiator family protein [Vicinamibacterales bacterium]|nr:septum formation initiator family protein [Vicinamibacterales bacterium]
MLPVTPQTPADESAAHRRTRRRLQPAHEVRARRRRIIGWAIFAVSGLLMVNALIGDNGYLATIRAQREYDALDASLTRIRFENQELGREIRRMRDDPTALEEVARREHGLIKPGETVVVVKDAVDPPRSPISK